NERMDKRGDMLPIATNTALNILSNNKKGFFIMIEGSAIDWGAHANNTIYVIEEMLDTDRAIGKVLEFAAKDKNTLVIVTADHETGGMAILDGSYETGMVKAGYTTKGHTGLMVPVLSYGPGAENFIGIMENTDIANKIKELMIGR
ncbi:MAG: alkaline phosphatase, partial [Bacteroidales bacterium]|nr:alkaline phosphatase [Bacteroidales bacterium]